MQRCALALLLLPITAWSEWTAPGFPAFTANGSGVYHSEATFKKGTTPLTLKSDNACWQPATAPKLNQMLSLQPCTGDAPQWRIFRDGDYALQIDTRSGTPTLMLTVAAPPEAEASTAALRQCPVWDGKPLTVDVSKTFAPSTLSLPTASSTAIRLTTTAMVAIKMACRRSPPFTAAI